MPRVEFKEENVKKNEFDYPKLKLKKGEVARIAILEAPVAEFVHNLRKPKLVNGVPEKEIKTRFRDGQQYEDYKYEFVARPICLGDYGKLVEEGSDPDACPICAEAKKSDRFFPPQRRFALHVVKYETKPNSTTVKEPFGAQTLIWSFTDKVFSKLYGFKEQGFDLTKNDIILKCENEPFQTYEISISMEGAWRENKERQAYIKSLLQPENLASDLSVFAGSKKSESSVGYDIRAVNEAWAVATGVQTISKTDAAISHVGAGSLVDGIDAILGGTQPTTTEDAWAPGTTPLPVASFEELTGEADDSLASSVGASDDVDDDELTKLISGF